MIDMTDEQLLGYLHLHCQTELGKTHKKHLFRLHELAGVPAPEDLDHRDWWGTCAEDLHPLIAKARARQEAITRCNENLASILRNLPDMHPQDRADFLERFERELIALGAWRRAPGARTGFEHMTQNVNPAPKCKPPENSEAELLRLIHRPEDRDPTEVAELLARLRRLGTWENGQLTPAEPEPDSAEQVGPINGIEDLGREIEFLEANEPGKRLEPTQVKTTVSNPRLTVLRVLKENADWFRSELETYPVIFRLGGFRHVFESVEDFAQVVAALEAELGPDNADRIAWLRQQIASAKYVNALGDNRGPLGDGGMGHHIAELEKELAALEGAQSEPDDALVIRIPDIPDESAEQVIERVRELANAIGCDVSFECEPTEPEKS